MMISRWRMRVCALVAMAIAVAAGPALATPAPKVGHVFVIVLENEAFETTFGANSKAPYLAATLPGQGVLLTQYYGTAHYSLGNYLAMISGQAANPDTHEDCETFSEFVLKGMTKEGQAVGRGCVYPATVRTLADQLEAKGLGWKGYFEDMGNDPAREAATCGHPVPGTADGTQKAMAPTKAVPRGDQYAARHNPFVYFHSIIDSPACARHVVRLETLEGDLREASRTPAFSFITPNLCHDGHDAPCANGEPGGLVSADAFLRTWVPRILASPAYQRDGLLVITFDEGDVAPVAQPGGTFRVDFPGASCCYQQPGPNLPAYPVSEDWENYHYNFQSFGGDRTGALLLSPFLAPGTRSATPFNHYALLRTIEDLLGVGGHLGYAGQPGLVGFFEAPGSELRLEAPHAPR